jgi:hypothetical protein
MLRIGYDYPKFLVAHIIPAGNYDLYEEVSFEVARDYRLLTSKVSMVLIFRLVRLHAHIKILCDFVFSHLYISLHS